MGAGRVRDRVTPLENPRENACWGCGPANARGLGLSFARDADAGVVRCTYTPRADETGWPGLFHTGLQYLVLFEASYWAALASTDRVHVAQGPQTFEQARLPRVGHPFTTEARVVDRDPLLTRAVSRTHDGKDAARLDVAWRPGSRAVVERAGLALPEYLLAHMDP